MNRRDFLAAGIAWSGAGLAGRAPAAPPPDTPPYPPGPKFLTYPAQVDRLTDQPLRPVPDSASGAFDVGDRAQLFVDQQWVRASEGIAFTLHPGRKHPGNPLIRADRPWEGWRVFIYGTVLYDEEEGIFKMWYNGSTTKWFPNYAALYATSGDGLGWDKPPLGTLSVPGVTGHNAVLDAGMLPSVTKDPSEPDPSRRYKMIAWFARGGIRPKSGQPGWPGRPAAFASPDGLHWTLLSKEPLFPSSDVVTSFYDRRRKLHVAMPKLLAQVHGTVRRCFGLSTSPDLKNWTEPRFILKPDRRDDVGSLARLEAVRSMLSAPDDPALMRTEFYGVGAYQAESCILGFPWVFTVNNNVQYLDQTANQDGPSEIQLAVTRDLEHWERPFRTPVIPNGPVGSWDSGFLRTASQAIRFGDEIRLYYGAGNFTHGNPAPYYGHGLGQGTRYTEGIGLATWPLDRFVSADAGGDGGRLTTEPMQFTGRRLELNLNARRGGLTVTLLDAAQRPLPGCGRSDPLTSDSLRATVAWSGNSDLSRFAGRPVSLRFEMKEAELYSFAFRA